MPALTRARILELAGLSRRRERARLGLFLVEGVRGVEAAVAAGAPLEGIAIASEASTTPRVSQLLADSPAPVWRVSERDMARLSDARTSQGIVGIAQAVTIDFDAAAPPAGRVVVLDGVQDPGNVGTIIRTAAWFGASAVIAGPGTADPESPKVVRGAAGALWDLRLLRATHLDETLGALANRGYPLYGADARGMPYDEWKPETNAALVLGSEAEGLSAEARARLDAVVAIPRTGHAAGVESLNVAVAAGILLARWSGASV